MHQMLASCPGHFVTWEREEARWAQSCFRCCEWTIFPIFVHAAHSVVTYWLRYSGFFANTNFLFKSGFIWSFLGWVTNVYLPQFFFSNFGRFVWIICSASTDGFHHFSPKVQHTRHHKLPALQHLEDSEIKAQI